MPNPTYKIIVDDKFEFDSSQLGDLDVVPDGAEHYHILHGHKAFHADVLEKDPVARTYTIRINGTAYEIKILDDHDLLVKRLGLAAVGAQKITDVKAPMPGLVLSIDAKAGQEVQKGDPLLILEAMKMENVIKAPGDGIIKSIEVEKGQPVEKGQLLIEME